jgi:hypothetical protein
MTGLEAIAYGIAALTFAIAWFIMTVSAIIIYDFWREQNDR